MAAGHVLLTKPRSIRTSIHAAAIQSTQASSPKEAVPGGGTSSESKAEGTAKAWTWESSTPEQVAAVKVYTGGDYYTINNALRGKGRVSERHAAAISKLDEITSSSTYSGKLFRGIGESAVASLERDGLLEKGAIINEFGFMSMSKHEGSAKAFAASSSRGILLRIVAPEGSKAADISGGSKFKGEAEVLGARGSRMKVKKYDPKKRVLDVELLPPERQGSAHDCRRTGVSVAADSVDSQNSVSLMDRWRNDGGFGSCGGVRADGTVVPPRRR